MQNIRSQKNSKKSFNLRLSKIVFRSNAVLLPADHYSDSVEQARRGCGFDCRIWVYVADLRHTKVLN